MSLKIYKNVLRKKGDSKKDDIDTSDRTAEDLREGKAKESRFTFDYVKRMMPKTRLRRRSKQVESETENLCESDWPNNENDYGGEAFQLVAGEELNCSKRSDDDVCLVEDIEEDDASAAVAKKPKTPTTATTILDEDGELQFKNKYMEIKV